MWTLGFVEIYSEADLYMMRPGIEAKFEALESARGGVS